MRKSKNKESEVLEQLHILGDNLKRIENVKIPPTRECLDIMRQMDAYHEDVLKKSERIRMESHLKKCLFCFKFHMDYSTILVQAEAGALKIQPEMDWVKDISVKMCEGFDLWKRLKAFETVGKLIMAVRLFRCATGVRRTAGAKTPAKYMAGDIAELEVSADSGGYLTVIHIDSEGNIHLAYPHKEKGGSDVLITEGESRNIFIKVTPPLGEASFKIFITRHKIIEPTGIEFRDKESELTSIRKFLDEIKHMNSDDFSASTKNYIVIYGR